MKKDLIQIISRLCDSDSSKVIDKLYLEGLLDSNSVRNYLIRRDFELALKRNNKDLIKHIFIDISDKYEISFRQAQRIVYDYMKNKVSVGGNTK